MEGVTLERTHAVELSFLSVATVYSLTLPLKSSITLIDAAILVSHLRRLHGPDLQGPGRGAPPGRPGRGDGRSSRRRARRAAVSGCSSFAAAVILLCAEQFAHALVETGGEIGISEFFLVQWLAPLASEAPELLVAGLYACRLNTNAGLGTLVSSKVNQWTLLVGTLPIAFALASGSLDGLPDHRPAAGGGAAHGGPVVLRRRRADQPVDVGAGGDRSSSPCSGPSSSPGRWCPRTGTARSWCSSPSPTCCSACAYGPQPASGAPAPPRRVPGRLRRAVGPDQLGNPMPAGGRSH